MRHLDHEWRVIFEGVDQGELLSAIRGNDAWYEAVLKSRSRMQDDDECSTIHAAIPVATLAELLDLLTATKDVRADYGVMLHLYSKDGRVSFGATLTNSTAYSPSSATMTLMPPKQGENPNYDALLGISRQVSDLLSAMKTDAVSDAGA